MLLERMQASDAEFIECCQQAGLIGTSQSCPSGCGAMRLVCCTAGAGGGGGHWKCLGCGAYRALGTGTWIYETSPLLGLKPAVLTLYFWTWGYPVVAVCHEAEAPPSLVVPLYARCSRVCSDYFRNEVSNVGGPGESVELVRFETPGGLIVLGGMELRSKMNPVFFRVLPARPSRDDVISAIVDNVASGTTIHCGKDIMETLGLVGTDYLQKMWKLYLEPKQNESALIKSTWEEYEVSLPPGTSPRYTPKSLDEFLFRKRMAASRDPFLYFLAIVSTIYPAV
ncbi:hypothetical protein AAG570_005312 [Ranatra chinensis]|uniref:Uncharacterized protein n=1 Tax=Ranatra chinensis TaxID=642074 RepID=A0ABD0Y032_9HEMI